MQASSHTKDDHTQFNHMPKESSHAKPSAWDETGHQYGRGSYGEESNAALKLLPNGPSELPVDEAPPYEVPGSNP